MGIWWPIVWEVKRGGCAGWRGEPGRGAANRDGAARERRRERRQAGRRTAQVHADKQVIHAMSDNTEYVKLL